ncbi:bystin [Argentina anserina]|uniref:bystin n=1 Tax=Argentina anserina TaxID=57926 RepID=UPI0021762F38|nr:bystin [Potentilla anserina]
MPKKRGREKHHNPEPFLADDDGAASVASKRRTKAKQHQADETPISSGMSAKILKQAQLQQREVEDDENRARNPNALSDITEEPHRLESDEDEDADEFGGFLDSRGEDEAFKVTSRMTKEIGKEYEKELGKAAVEEDERLLEAFLSKDAGPQLTLADLIVARIKENDSNVNPSNAGSDMRPLPKLDADTIEIFKGVGQFLKKYTAGKVPKPFKHIPSMNQWEDLLYLTEPENWSPNAMYQATRIFASNLTAKKVERFYKLILLPRVREDIRKNKRLHFALYQALKKSLYKPAAFFKGILLPLCESGTCNLREAVIVGSVLQKVSIPPLHSSVAVMKLADMEYCGTTSYFIKLLLEKKYALPFRVIDALVGHFMRFMNETRVMPVIWHQSLLAFVERYKNDILNEYKDNLRVLLQTQRHDLVTREIRRELDNSRSRGEKEDDLMSIASPDSVMIKPVEEDMFDIPEVPMEDD